MIPDANSVPVSNGPRGLCILGSTGSIGTQTLDIVRLFPDRFAVKVLTAHDRVDELIRQAKEFRPKRVVISWGSGYDVLCDALKDTGIEVCAGVDDLRDVVTMDGIDVVMAAVVGFAGLAPVIEAVRAGRTVALANKETLVVGGAVVHQIAEESGAVVIPVDSEHSAIFQCLVGEDISAVEELILTASGGPFRNRPVETFESITRQEALDHPNWSMGAKITVDSATMMNKGLEVIEARWLFGMEPGRIRVLVHPQSIVHSIVSFVDGSMKAQLGVPDMKVPIQYALSYPDRWEAPHERVDWTRIRKLDFEEPDVVKFPCLRLAYEALEKGGVAPVVLNAANETAVDLFLKDEIRFTDIPDLIEKSLERVPSVSNLDTDSLFRTDVETRRFVMELNRSTVH